jgi:hypothetical protein
MIIPCAKEAHGRDTQSVREDRQTICRNSFPIPGNSREMAPEPQKLKPMSKSICISLPGGQSLSPAGSASRNMMRFLRHFAASSSAIPGLTQLTRINRLGHVSQKQVRGELT